MPETAGCRIRIRLSRRRGLADLRRAVCRGRGHARKHSPHPRAARSRRGPCGRGLCPLHRQTRRGPRHQRSGRHQRGDRDCRCLYGFDSDGGHHRAGADRPDRQRRVSGSGHGRPHPPLHEAQLSRERPRTAARDDRGSVPHRHDRAARSGGDRHSQGRADRNGDVERSGYRTPPLAPLRTAPCRGGRRNCASRRNACFGAAAGLLHRRRRDQCRAAGFRTAARLAAAHRRARHQHANGPRRLPRRPS